MVKRSEAKRPEGKCSCSTRMTVSFAAAFDDKEFKGSLSWVNRF